MSGTHPVRAALARLPHGQMLRFAGVGLAATAAHFAALTAGVELAGLASVPANGLAFLCAVTVTYFGQAIWVFRAAGHPPAQIQKFLISAGSGFLANIALMALITGPLGLHYLWGFAAVTTLVPLGTFLVNKFWVFAPLR